MPDKKDNRLEHIRAKRQRRGNNDVADWGSVSAERIVYAIAVVAARGGALRFGYTRDGGAYAIGIYLGNDHYTEYVRPSEDIDGYLEGLAVDIGGSE